MTPRVSIIIPMYNAAKFIETCVDSILLQTLEDLEIILIDDKSSDGTLDLVRSKYGENSRVRIFSSVRKNHEWGGRNLGLQMASGDYVFFMDHDDLLLPNAMETLYNTAEETQAESVHFNSYYTNLTDVFSLTDDMRVIKLLDSIPPDKFLPVDLEWRLFQSEYSISVMGWQKLMRRDFLVESGLYFPDMWISSDSMHFFGELCLARKIFIVDGCGYVYRQNPTSQMRSNPMKKFHYVVENFQPMLDFMEEIFSLKTIEELPKDLQIRAAMDKVDIICMKFAVQAIKNGASLEEIDNVLSEKISHGFLMNSKIVKTLFHMAMQTYLNKPRKPLKGDELFER